MFFLTDDERFIIKSARKAEVSTLLTLLPAYHKHLGAHPDSLIARFYGVYGIKQKGLGAKTVCEGLASHYHLVCGIKQKGLGAKSVR